MDNKVYKFDIPDGYKVRISGGKVFLEPKESEDERIRKFLIEILSHGTWRKEWPFGPNEVVAYLERQKEQDWNKKPCLTCQEYEKGHKQGYTEGCTAGYNKAMKEVEQKEQRSEEVDESTKRLNDNWMKQHFDDYKEQKPEVEICPHSIKSKSYKETGYPIENCDYGLEIALQILTKTLGKVTGYQSDDGIREHQTAIQAVKEAMKEQKPEEWSEEDEKMIEAVDNFLWILDSYIGDDCSLDEEKTQESRDAIKTLSVWLKSLRPQPKQEWSEEDEKILDSLIRLYSREYSAYAWPWANGTFTYGDVVNFLKSLRPSWKPSEEQMETIDKNLLTAAIAFVDLNPYNYWCGIDKRKVIKALRSLKPQWKPSEQEKGALRTAIYVLTDERNFPKTAEQLQNILNAFEGIESRKDWKPSEEQMNALNALNCHGDLSYVGQQNQLISLYNDLKKLKGSVAPMRDIDE